MRPFVKREGRVYDQRQMTGKVACGNPACVQLHRNVDEARACFRPAQRIEGHDLSLGRALAGEALGQYEYRVVLREFRRLIQDLEARRR
jgi:hypothetical protein